MKRNIFNKLKLCLQHRFRCLLYNNVFFNRILNRIQKGIQLTETTENMKFSEVSDMYSIIDLDKKREKTWRKI